jgi:hypothetical protein
MTAVTTMLAPPLLRDLFRREIAEQHADNLAAPVQL